LGNHGAKKGDEIDSREFKILWIPSMKPKAAGAGGPPIIIIIVVVVVVVIAIGVAVYCMYFKEKASVGPMEDAPKGDASAEVELKKDAVDAE
jgi:flagellar basal body-associated protein FliL